MSQVILEQRVPKAKTLVLTDWRLPASLCASTFGHLGCLLVAFMLSQVVPDALTTNISEEEPVTFQTVSIPRDFFVAAAEEEPVPETKGPTLDNTAAHNRAESQKPSKMKRPWRKKPEKPKKSSPQVNVPKFPAAVPVVSVESKSGPTNVEIVQGDGTIEGRGPDVDLETMIGAETKGKGTGIEIEANLEQSFAVLLRGYKSTVSGRLRSARTYPRAARRRGMQGTVILDVVVNASGEIIKVKIVRSSGFDILDNAAVKTVHSVGQLPRPPYELRWQTRAIRVPFNYVLKHS